jgi:hypothetical protein
MSNIVESIEGTSGPVRALKIVWKTKQGLYTYNPTDDETVKVRLFDKNKKVIYESECQYKDENLLVYFPSDLPAGDYDYEVVIDLQENDEKRTVTLLSSKYHIGRR